MHYASLSTRGNIVDPVQMLDNILLDTFYCELHQTTVFRDSVFSVPAVIAYNKTAHGISQSLNTGYTNILMRYNFQNPRVDCTVKERMDENGKPTSSWAINISLVVTLNGTERSVGYLLETTESYVKDFIRNQDL